MTFTIEPAKVSDRDVLIKFFLAMLEYLRPLGHDIEPSLETATQWVDGVFYTAAGEGSPILLARDSDGLASGAIFCVIGPEMAGVEQTAFTYGVWVEPDCRKHGLCTQLLNTAWEKLQAHGIGRMLDTALVGNEAGNRAALKGGMRAIATVYERTD